MEPLNNFDVIKEGEEVENENKEEETIIIYPPILNKLEKLIFPLFTRFVKRIPFNNFFLILFKILEDIQWLLFSLREDWFNESKYFYYEILNNLDYKPRFIISIIFLVLQIFNFLYMIYFKNHLYNKNKPNKILFGYFTGCIYLLSTIFYVPLYIFTSNSIFNPNIQTIIGSNVKYIILLILSSINLIIHTISGYTFSKYFINPFIMNKNLIISRASNSIIEKEFIIKLIMLLDIDIFKFILEKMESMIIAIALLFYILYSYLDYYPYFNQNINYSSISFIACALYQTILTLFFNFINFNNAIAWRICMYSSIAVIPIMWFLAKFRYKKLIKFIYKNIRDKKLLQKNKINKKYINKLSNDQLIESMDDILNKSMPKIKKNMFKKSHHCELACRYIANNRDPEAYQLMKYVFSEGILQYSNCTQLYIEFWFFFYSLRTFLKNNYRKLNLYMDATEIKNMNQLIEIAKSKKPCSRDTLLITIAINLIEKEEKKIANETNNDKLKEITNTSIEYRQLKSSAIELHLKALSEIKVLLKSLRASSNKKDTYYYIDCIKNLSKYQVKCNKKYNQLITKYEKTKTILHLYVIFIVHIMNQPENAFKYLKNIGDRNLYNDCIKTYCEIERSNGEYKYSNNTKSSVKNLRSSLLNIKSSATTLKKASEANLRELMNNNKKSLSDLPYQMRKLGATMDQNSIMTVGVINNIRKISGDYVRRSSIDMSKLQNLEGSNNRKSSIDNIRRPSFDYSKKRLSIDNVRKPSIDFNKNRLSVDNIKNFSNDNSRTRSSFDIRRTSFDQKSSFDGNRRRSSVNFERKTSGENVKRISFDDNTNPINSNTNYHHKSQQLPTIKNESNLIDFNDNNQLHSILRYNSSDQNEDENTIKHLHSKRFSITFNPIVESNIFINEPEEEEEEEVIESSTNSSEFIDGIKPLGYSYGITSSKKPNSNFSSKNKISTNSLLNNSDTSTSQQQKYKSGSLVAIPKTSQPRRRSVYESKKQNSIHDIVHLYSKNDITENPVIPEHSDEDDNNKHDDDDNIDFDIVPELLKPRNSFLNDDYKIEVQQRRRLSELNRRRSLYSNGRLSISHNLKSSDSLNDDIDTFYVKHSEFTKVLSLRNKMKNRYLNPFKKYTSRMKSFLIVLLIAVTLNFAINLLLYSNIIGLIPMIKTNIQGYWLSSTLALKSRLTSIAYMGKSEELYNSISPLNEYINNELDELINDNLLSFSSYSLSKEYLLYSKSNDTTDSMVKSDIFDLIISLSTVNSIINETDYSTYNTNENYFFNPYYRFFAENNKNAFKIIFEESMDSIINQAEQKCSLQNILTLIIMAFIVIVFFLLIFLVLKPIIKYTISTETKSLTMFGRIPKSCIDEMIKKYENQLQFLAENFDDDDTNEQQNDNNEENNKKNIKKDFTLIDDNQLTSFTSQHPTFWTYMYFIIGILLIAIPTFALFYPVMTFKTELISNLNYQMNSAKKGYYINQMLIYSYEQFFNDEFTYVKYETKRKLDEYLELLENIDRVYQESDSKASINSNNDLNNVSYEQGCIRKKKYEEVCSNRVYDSSYGYTEEIANIPYNLKMNEYLVVIKRFIRDISDFTPEGNFFNENDLNSQIKNVINNKFIKYQNSLKDDVFGAIYRINELFITYIYSFINQNVVKVFIIYILSLFTTFFCYKCLFKKITTAKEKELEYLAFFVFIVPQFYIKNNESYQRFLETGQIEEE